MNNSFRLEKNQIDVLFPFHFWVDENLKIKSVGKSLLKMYPKIREQLFWDYFSIKSPFPSNKKTTLEDILNVSNKPFFIYSNYDNRDLLFKVQILKVDELVLFAGTPWLAGSGSVFDLGLSHSDFSLHDPSVDLSEIIKINENAITDIEFRRDKEVEGLAKFPDENPDPILRVNNSGNILYVNRAYKVYFPEWNYRKNTSCPDELIDCLKKSLKVGSHLRMELKVDKKYFDFLFVPLEEHGYVNIYANDISANKKSEKILQLSKERYKQIVEDSSDIIYRMDKNGVIEYANPIAHRELLIDGEIILGKHFLELVKPDWQEKVMSFYKVQLDQKNAFTQLEFPIIGKDGKEQWLNQNVKILFNDEDVVGFQAVARNVTDRKMAEKSLEAAKKRSRRSTLFKRAFFG